MRVLNQRRIAVIWSNTGHERLTAWFRSWPRLSWRWPALGAGTEAPIGWWSTLGLLACALAGLWAAWVHLIEPLLLIAIPMLLMALVSWRCLGLLQRQLDSSEYEITGLRRHEARFRSLVHNATDTVMIVDAAGLIRYVTPSVERTLGHWPDDLVGKPILAIVEPADQPAAKLYLGGLASWPGVTPSTEWRLVHADGCHCTVRVIGKNLMDDPSVSGLVLTLSDVSRCKALEEQLTHQALFDRLTGLANRALFLARLERALVGPGGPGRSLAILIVDIDNFKGVLDGRGHLLGDRILTTMANRILGCVRPDDVVARVSGDEFAVIMAEGGTATAAMSLADTMTAAVAQPLQIGEIVLQMSATIGISLSTNGRESADEMIHNAEVAMLMAKRRGAGRSIIFEEAMRRTMRERRELDLSLRQAVKQQEFRLHYQPTVELGTGRVTGVEALLRWTHPTQGLISPGRFIGVAEESDLILPLGRWVLGEACRQLSEWHRRFPLAQPLSISVNLSARQLQSTHIVNDIAGALADTALEPRFLVIELTETALAHDIEVVRSCLLQLKRLGVQVAIDDFGIGYSSLSYLRQFPVDILKIDRSFINELTASDHRASLTGGIIALGQNLKLQIVAEGVESVEQVERLRQLDCDLGQGFFFYPPLDATRLDSLMVRHQWHLPLSSSAAPKEPFIH